MKKWFLIGAGVIVVVGLAAAGFFLLRDTGPRYYKPDTRVPNFSTHLSRQSLDWSGTYVGVTPCADCAGIDTTLTLRPDGTFKRDLLYVGKSNELITEQGKFEWRDNGADIALILKNAAILYKVGENRLFMLDADGNRITGMFADRYILVKVPE